MDGKEDLRLRLVPRSSTGEEEVDESLGKRIWEESKKLWVVAGPAIFTRFSTFGVSVISQAFLGHIGATELAAYALVFTVLTRFAAGILLGMAPPSSPSYTVSSPRRTLSLVRKKRTKYKSPEASAWEREERKDGPITGGPSGPKPSEVYGFVGAITTVVATSIFLVWAYTPESWLHWLGITYYPSKYWTLAIPTYAMVTVVLAMVFYVAMNFMITPSPTSFNTIFDEYSREPVEHVSLGSDEERPIEPISDIGINYINDLMFGGAS